MESAEFFRRRFPPTKITICASQNRGNLFLPLHEKPTLEIRLALSTGLYSHIENVG